MLQCLWQANPVLFAAPQAQQCARKMEVLQGGQVYNIYRDRAFASLMQGP
jgi:hypothetical protein